LPLAALDIEGQPQQEQCMPEQQVFVPLSRSNVMLMDIPEGDEALISPTEGMSTCHVCCWMYWYLIMFAAASDSNPSLLLRFFFLRWPSQSFVCLWILSACWQLYRTIYAQQHGQWNEWCQVCCECYGFVVLFVGDHHCWFVFLFVLIFSTSAMSVSPRIMPDGGGSKWEDELNPPDNVPTLHMLEIQTKND
jgi:hypothetical protein